MIDIHLANTMIFHIFYIYVSKMSMIMKTNQEKIFIERYIIII